MVEEKPTARAPPRRGRKDPNEAPVFLQKTYQMIDTCPSDIAGWSEEGDTFIVKDMEEFANLLPRFFKHRNFRSFVRQLNFYGFRKLRTDGALISERPAHWWEFRHDKFLRGHSRLLVQIKRANHYEPAPSEQGEVEFLKTEVTNLRDRIHDMSQTIEHLTELVDTLLLERQEEADPLEIAGMEMECGSAKKRRLQRVSLRGVHPGIEREGLIVDSMTAAIGMHAPEMLSLPMDANSANEFPDISEDMTLPDLTMEGALNDLLSIPSTSCHPSTQSRPYVKTEEIEMPPVAPYLATAAIGAFFTKLATSADHTAMLPTTEKAQTLPVAAI